MTEAMLDLGRRAVACPGWRWMPGQPFVLGERRGVVVDGYCVAVGGGVACGNGAAWLSWAADMTCAIPIFEPGAGLGCLLAVVQGALGDGAACVALDAEALVAALEKAP